MDKWVTKRRREVTPEEENGGGSIKCVSGENITTLRCASRAKTADCHIPKCWNKEQLTEKQREYEWIVVENGKIGCSVCKACSNLGPHTSQGVTLNRDWQECKIEAQGESIQIQQRQFRVKIFKHKNSEAHKAALIIQKTSLNEPIENAITNQIKLVSQSTYRVFRTVYNICKTGRPFTDLPHLANLLELNGVEIGRVLQSYHSCADISMHIAHMMRQKLVTEIVSKKLKLGVMIDESTSVGKNSAFVICIRVQLEESEDATSVLLDLVELSKTNATDITNTLLQTLDAHGFHELYLTENWLSFACDGASNMLGRKAGVASKLREKFPKLIILHCCNHRLELAVNDVVNETSSVCHMKSFFDKLYRLYSASPKNCSELNECAASLGVQVNKIGRLLGVRWVASSARLAKLPGVA